MVAVTDDVMQLAVGKLEELEGISVSVTLKPFPPGTLSAKGIEGRA